MIESLDELNSHYINSGLTIEHMNNISNETLPDLHRLERKAAKVMNHPRVAKLMFALLPEQFVTNIIVGYLGYIHVSLASSPIKSGCLGSPMMKRRSDYSCEMFHCYFFMFDAFPFFFQKNPKDFVK